MKATEHTLVPFEHSFRRNKSFLFPHVDEIVEFETALMMHDMGFDDDCEGYYHDYRDEPSMQEGSKYDWYEIASWTGNLVSNSTFTDNERIACPTIAQAVDWTSKMTGKFVLAYLAESNTVYDIEEQFAYQLISFDTDGHPTMPKLTLIHSKTYEEAVNKGIRQALSMRYTELFHEQYKQQEKK